MKYKENNKIQLSLILFENLFDSIKKPLISLEYFFLKNNY